MAARQPCSTWCSRHECGLRALPERCRVRNRVHEYVRTHAPSDTTADTVNAAVGGLIERFNAIDKLAKKGVHADVGVPEAELCAIHSYLAAGELLALGQGAG
jgi:hypothetical protein